MRQYLPASLRNPRVADGVPRVAHVHVRLAVTFARPGQHGVGAAFDATLDHAREVDTQEREIGIGYRVDQVPAQVMGRGFQFVVLAAKRHDPHGRLLATHGHDTVAIQPRTVDQRPCAEGAAGCLQHKPVAVGADAHDLRLGPDLTARLLDEFRQSLADLAEIDNPGFGNMQGIDTRGVRFQFPEPCRRDPFALHAVGEPPLVNSLQGREFLFVYRHNDFAARFVRDIVFPTEGLHGLFSRAAVRGLE